MAKVDQKVVLVSRKTRLDELVERFNTRSQAKFYIKRSRENALVSAGQNLGNVEREAEQEYHEYEAEHTTYYINLAKIRTDLERVSKVHVLSRELLPNYVFAASDMVVTVGQDGLVANTAKYALERPIIAVNPDQQRIDGILLPFHAGEAAEAVHQVLRGQARIQSVTLAEATLNDGQRLLAFNELFIGAKSHISARYQIELGERSELHSSSGVLVSTGAGSTGWVSSVFNMVAGVNSFSGVKGKGKAAGTGPVRRPWDDPNLIFVVREPFVSKVSQAGIVAGLVRPAEPLTISSNMPQHGVIFSDGVEADFLSFNTGAIASIGAAKERALLVVK